MDFPKVFYCIFKMAHLTPALLTPALINATPKNNAELGPALKGPIRYLETGVGFIKVLLGGRQTKWQKYPKYKLLVRN